MCVEFASAWEKKEKVKTFASAEGKAFHSKPFLIKKSFLTTYIHISELKLKFFDYIYTYIHISTVNLAK